MRVVFVLLVSWHVANQAAAVETIAPRWSVADVGFGIKPSFGFSLDGRLHMTGMTEQFSGGTLWHATADSRLGTWESNIVARSFFYGPGDMVVAADGTAHIAVHDHNARDAMHIEVAPDGVATVRHIVTPNERDGWENSLAFDSIGNLYQATVNPAGNGVVDSLSFSSFNGADWVSEVIEGSGAFTHSLGTSLAFDANDEAHILFTPAQSQTEPTDLNHAFRVGDEWQISSIAQGGIRGRFSSLAFDASNRGHAAWLDIDPTDSSNATVMYGQFVDGAWSTSAVEQLSNVKLGPSGGLKMVSLVIDSNNTPHIAYGDSRTVNYAVRNDRDWKRSLVLHSAEDRYNGLTVLRLHPESDLPYVAFWEPHDSEAGVVRLLSQSILGDVDHDGMLSALDIDLIADEINSEDPNHSFDLNFDGTVDEKDHRYWVTAVRNTLVGDANLDGSFDSSDLVQVFTVAKYDRPAKGDAGWGEGDWNGDRQFNSTDLVRAFSESRYEQGVIAVPETNSCPLLLIAPLIGLRRIVGSRHRG